VTELDGDAGPDGAAATIAEEGDGTVVVKRKTRRGSRGGRNRRKKPAAVEGAEIAVATAVVDDPAEDGPELANPAPVVEPAVEPEGDADELVAEAPVPDESVADEPDVPGYVPMSEWLDDFDRR
jgi:hypothetical protein